MTQPRKVERRDDGGLSILWEDGHRSEYEARSLRMACRCAHCVDEWSGERRLEPARVPGDVRIERVRPVGRYGLQFVWSDGHGTGIYTFKGLREACPCEACRRIPAG
ncbi:MAG: DUF971 domain-containing protein [Acidobacteriota bacterium]